MTAYYNDNDPFLAAWLKNLIDRNLIAAGDVDSRSITEVSSSDLSGYDQCHFFAGIGVWSYALRLAGWADSKPVWTCSCPCQPWSQSGKKAGVSDERDLWPTFLRLADSRRPQSILGEQVAGKLARRWLERARNDSEKIGYKFISSTRDSAKFGAPQQRLRYFFLAHTGSARSEGLEPRGSAGENGLWRWRGKEDLRLISASPFEPGNRWPKPLLRRMDDGATNRVGRVRAYGNSIIPQVAAGFIRDVFVGPREGLFR